jgi:hypothetical protein
MDILADGFAKPEIDLLTNYTRSIVHMRRQLEAERFGLCFGAGISTSFGFPNWEGLVDRIAADVDVNGTSLANANVSQTSRTQMLYQHFRAQWLQKNDSNDDEPTGTIEREVQRAWLNILHRCLYQGIPENDQELKHDYLGEFLEVVRRSPMTVNYNFDDSIERMLSATRKEQEHSRGYETVWKPSTQFRLRQGIIYHPNGFLPYRLVEGFSPQLVFSEDAFADQLIDSMAGHYASLLSHLTKYTCLLLGLSLDDATLKHLLRQNALMNPGHYHYHVAFLKDDQAFPSPEQQRAIIDANFDTYNLITLFLRTSDIRALGRLLTVDKRQLEDAADQSGITLSSCYYLSGAVGTGKTTTVGFFNSLVTFDEWSDPKPRLLQRAHTDLNDSERQEVDAWIAAQFRKKNWSLSHDAPGIQVVDRCPLDPLAFTPKSEWIQKAQDLKNAVQPEKSKQLLRSGHVILLYGDEREMLARTKDRHKSATLEYLKVQQRVIRHIYDLPATTIVNVIGLSIRDVVKQVARIIHLEPYSEAPLHERLRAVIAGALRYPDDEISA